MLRSIGKQSGKVKVLPESGTAESRTLLSHKSDTTLNHYTTRPRHPS